MKWPVADGGIADIAIIAARDEANEIALFVSETKSITRKTLRLFRRAYNGLGGRCVVCSKPEVRGAG